MSLQTIVMSEEYIFIPVKSIVFDNYSKENWNLIIQKIEYIDGNKTNSLSSMWVSSNYSPLEIIVLDNPDIYDPKIYEFKKIDGIAFRKTKVFLPFSDVIFSEEFENKVPDCKENEFRAIVRIASSLNFTGVPAWDINNLESQPRLRPWYFLGNIICLKIIRS